MPGKTTMPDKHDPRYLPALFPGETIVPVFVCIFDLTAPFAVVDDEIERRTRKPEDLAQLSTSESMAR